MARTSASVTRPQRGEATEGHKVYLDALELSKAAGRTVCVVREHYIRRGREPRHPEPYRMGYHHGNPAHWHAGYDEYWKCKHGRV